MYKFAALAAALALTGCASITGKKLQPVSVITVYDNKEVAGIGCTLSNDAGNWFLTSPATVTVRKSTADLAVVCKKNDMAGNAMVVSKANAGVWGNIVFGGVVGYVVDRQTGAGFNYPTNVTIMLRQVEGAQRAVATAAPTATAATAAAVPSTAAVVTPAAAAPARPAIPAAAGNPFVEGAIPPATAASLR